jgi:hypothetical protein
MKARLCILAIVLPLAVTVAAQPSIHASLVIDLHQTSANEVIAVDLLKIRDGGTPGLTIQKIELPKDDALTRRVQFDAVAPGRYVVLAKGAADSLRVGTRVEVVNAPMPPLQMQLMPFQLRVRIRSDEEELSEGGLLLRHLDGLWEARAQLDGGSTTLPMWQGGTIAATFAWRGRVPFRQKRTIEPIDGEWSIDLAKMRVEGRVIDADTCAPVPNAGVALDMSSAEHYHLSVSTKAGDDGSFDFAPVIAGQHRIRAAAKGYPPSEAVYEFDESEEIHTLTIALQRKPMTMLTVFDSRGTPLGQTDVFVFRGSTSVAFGRTSADGTMPVYIDDGEEQTIFAVPRNGSFGIARIRSGTPAQTLTVPPPSARLVIRTESAKHDPIADIVVDLRFNGQMLPFEIQEALMARGAITASRSDGRIVFPNMPAGTYEIWPLNAPDEPLRVDALPGDNLAVLTFAPRI